MLVDGVLEDGVVVAGVVGAGELADCAGAVVAGIDEPAADAGGPMVEESEEPPPHEAHMSAARVAINNRITAPPPS